MYIAAEKLGLGLHELPHDDLELPLDWDLVLELLLNWGLVVLQEAVALAESLLRSLSGSFFFGGVFFTILWGTLAGGVLLTKLGLSSLMKRLFLRVTRLEPSTLTRTCE